MTGPFQTPQNEKSFSGLIDQVLLDTGRTAAMLSAIQYANATIRECHALGLFYSDLIEDQIILTGSPFIWTRPFKFRKLRTAQIDEYKNFEPDFGYMKMKLPGRQQGCEDRYYYAADDYFVFVGGTSGFHLNTATYYWPKSFQYYSRLGATGVANYPGSGYTTRPAYYDKIAEEWMYLNLVGTAYVNTLGDPTEEEIRRNNAMGWMTRQWYELIQEGTKNKIFNLFGDSRAGPTFSMYKSMQGDLKSSVQFESENV